MGRRSRHNQGNLGNYFQNLKDYFLGTNKANKASDDITREYQKQIDERTKKRNEERTQELSDFDTARSQAAEDIRKQNKAGYDAAVSTRQTALQDADAKYKKAEWARNQAADMAVIQQRKKLLQDDFDKNGGIYYDLNDGGFKLRDISSGTDQPVAARFIPSDTPIVIARKGKSGQLEVLDPTADQKIISNTLAGRPFKPHMGTPNENTEDAKNAQNLFNSYLSRDADTDLKVYGINPEDIRSTTRQNHSSTGDYTADKKQAEADFNNNQAAQAYLGADDFVKSNGKYNESARNHIVNDTNESGKDYKYDINDIEAERDGKIGVARFKARATSPAAITAGAVVGLPTAAYALNRAYNGTIDSLAEMQRVPDGSAPGGVAEEQKAQITAAKNLKQAIADQKAQEAYYNQLESSGAIKPDEPIAIQNMRNGIEPERVQALQKVQDATAQVAQGNVPVQVEGGEPEAAIASRGNDSNVEYSPEVLAILQMLQENSDNEDAARALADYTYNNYRGNKDLNRLGWRAFLKQLYDTQLMNKGYDLNQYRVRG